MSIAEKLTTIAENQQKVFDAGKKAEWDAFWDAFQLNGTRTSYTYAFLKWQYECFKPKYDLVLTGSGANAFQNMFDASGFGGASLKAILEECGVVLDTSGCTNVTYMFRYSRITELPTIDTTSASALTSTFGDTSYLTTIEKLVLKDDGSQSFSNTFAKCYKLANIVIEGVIGNNLDISACSLSKDSVTSVVNALSTTASGKTLTLKQTARDAFANIEWQLLIADKTNWTFSFV